MKLIKTIGGFIMKHERILLTIVTIGAEGIAIYEGLKQGPVFDEVLEKVKNDEMTKKEAAKELALPAVKVAVPFAISGTAAILNHKKASDTIQSLSSLIMLSKEANDFKDAYKQQSDAYHSSALPVCRCQPVSGDHKILPAILYRIICFELQDVVSVYCSRHKARLFACLFEFELIHLPALPDRLTIAALSDRIRSYA